MILSNITSTPSSAASLLTLNVTIFPDHQSSVGYYPTQSRAGTCTAPVPYPSGDPQEVPALPLLIDAFVQGAAVENEQDPNKRLRKASLHFLASVFANITIVSHLPQPQPSLAANSTRPPLVGCTSSPLDRRIRSTKRRASSIPLRRWWCSRSIRIQSGEGALLLSSSKLQCP